MPEPPKPEALEALTHETVAVERDELEAPTYAGPEGPVNMKPIPSELRPHFKRDDGSVFAMIKSMVLIGRVADGTDLQVDDEEASRHHASVTYGENGFELHDLGSTNGTELNGEKIESAPLNDGDEIRIGGVTLVFRV